MDIKHIVKERFHDFDSALRDLTDPLNMLSLISHFPGHRLFKINPTNLEISKKLLLIFKTFIMKGQMLEKVFLSTKGIYFQVNIRGH